MLDDEEKGRFDILWSGGKLFGLAPVWNVVEAAVEGSDARAGEVCSNSNLYGMKGCQGVGEGGEKKSVETE